MRIRKLGLVAFCLIFTSSLLAQPALLTWDELVALYQYDPPSPRLAAKMHTLLTTPFVSNRAFHSGRRPLKPSSPALGTFLRIAQWNIERGLEFDAIRLAFTDPRGFNSLMEDKRSKADEAERARIRDQISTLREADVIVLNEVDWGMNRTRFRNVAADLAEALHMNYAWGVEFIEVDPITMGIDQHLVVQEVEETYADRSQDKQELLDCIHRIMKPDPKRYKGLHGNAILSRYPLSNVRVVPFNYQGHDWYADEKKRVSVLTKAEAKASIEVFREQFVRQVRRGGRMMLFADVTDPAIPSGRATIVATHLEDVTPPENRSKQLAELLARIRSIQHPVILAGDMNTSSHDGTPITVTRLFKQHFGNGRWWAEEGATTALRFGTPLGWFYDASLGLVGFARKVDDPTERSIPLLGENHEAKFFSMIEHFRFADGSTFDFRGEPNRSSSRRGGKLADSNERATKGFEPTEELGRRYGPIGQYKLDWIFVKPGALTDPHDRAASYQFAPHFAQTMKALNHSIPERISDHNPITADLPFREPVSAAQTAHA